MEEDVFYLHKDTTPISVVINADKQKYERKRRINGKPTGFPPAPYNKEFLKGTWVTENEREIKFKTLICNTRFVYLSGLGQFFKTSETPELYSMEETMESIKEYAKRIKASSSDKEKYKNLLENLDKCQLVEIVVRVPYSV